MKRWAPLLTACAVVACTPTVLAQPAAPPTVEPPAEEAPGDELTALLRGDPALDGLLADAERRRMQILVAVPTQDAAGRTTLRRLGFRVDAEYFYPASAVKLVSAVAALEKLADLRLERSRALEATTPLRLTESNGGAKRTIETSLRDELERALVVSDNVAHNRLFAFVGKEELAERLARLGLSEARLAHGLGDGGEPNATFELAPPGAEPVAVSYRTGRSLAPVTAAGTRIGTSHVDETGRVVPSPMDFSDKNRVPLRELQDLLVAVTRPDLADTPPLALAERDRELLMTLLGRLPSELRGLPDATAELDDRNKPLLRAVTSAVPKHRVRVLGKGGRAYGFHVECAYVVDETTGRSMFVAATIHANDNGTLNDDLYEYASVADPFVTQFGRVLARAFLAGAPAPVP